MLRRNEWIIKLELENIRRKIVFQKEKDIKLGNNNNIGEWFNQDKEDIDENKAT